MRLRLGTRRSKLALAQANELEEALRRAAGVGVDVQVEIVPMVTSGDRDTSASASMLVRGSAGRKGLFVGEIVDALQRGEIDLAVHSAKDLPAGDPDGIIIGAVPERASPYDVLITRERELSGAVVGTGSIRRRAQLAVLWPHVRVTDVRGNVDTRLAKLAAGEVDGLVLAEAGLRRLGIEVPNVRTFAPDEMLPAPGQGSLAVQVRADDEQTAELVKQVDHLRSRVAFEAERSLMAALGGGCDLPLGALAQVEPNGPQGVELVAAVISPEGKRIVRAEARAGSPAEAARAVAGMLRERGAQEILSAVAAAGSGAET